MNNIQPPIWVSEAEVVSLVDLGEAIQSVREGFALQARDGVSNLPKAQQTHGGATLHATGAVMSAGGMVGAKVWAHTHQGASPLMQVWSADSGRLLAVIEAFALGQYRTAAVSGVATDLLAAPDATVLAILGTGSQALAQVAAVTAVRHIERIHVWSPRPESREKFCKAVEDALLLTAVPFETPAEAVAGAQIVTIATRAKEPFLEAGAVSFGTHINAIGAIGLDRAEFEPKLLDRAGVIAVDDLGSAQAFSRELREFFGDGPWDAVTPLSAVVAADAPRDAATDVTLFKAMGVGVADLAIASFVLEQARENNLGTPLPEPSRSRPRLRSSLQKPVVGYV